MHWTVHMDVETDEPIDGAALWALAELGGSASGAVGEQRVGATTTEAAPDGDQALSQALARVRAVVSSALMAAEVMTTVEAERRLAEPPFPELVGIAEVAHLLGVTRQRASALQANPSFPAPVAILASGPVWQRDDLTRFEATWPRRPGHPVKTQTA